MKYRKDLVKSNLTKKNSFFIFFQSSFVLENEKMKKQFFLFILFIYSFYSKATFFYLKKKTNIERDKPGKLGPMTYTHTPAHSLTHTPLTLHPFPLTSFNSVCSLFLFFHSTLWLPIFHFITFPCLYLLTPLSLNI